MQKDCNEKRETAPNKKLRKSVRRSQIAPKNLTIIYKEFYFLICLREPQTDNIECLRKPQTDKEKTFQNLKL